MPFDFENLEVYRNARQINLKTIALIKDDIAIPRAIKDQLVRAASSIMLNIAEGSGRFTKRDKRNFYVIARGSVFECVAICDILMDASLISEDKHKELYLLCELQSRKLWGIIHSLNPD